MDETVNRFYGIEAHEEAEEEPSEEELDEMGLEEENDE